MVIVLKEMPNPGLPARIDREALERIIRRAAELQAGSREIGDVLSPEEVVKLGKDVGIPEGYLQQALLEEATRPAASEGGGFLDQAMGPAVVTAQRVVMGEVESVGQGLLEWMEENELLAVTRQAAGRLAWEPLRGFQAAVRRGTAALGGGRKPFMLVKADEVTATVVPLEQGYCNVVLTATMRSERGRFIGGAAALGALGLAASAALAVMTPFWIIALAPLPLGLAAGWGVARQFRPAPARVQMGLERALDSLERGVVKSSHQLKERPSILGLLADEVRKALKP